MPLKQRTGRLQRSPKLLDNNNILKTSNVKLKCKRRKSKEHADGKVKGIKSKIQLLCDNSITQLSNVSFTYLNPSDSDDSKTNDTEFDSNLDLSSVNLNENVIKNDLSSIKMKLSPLLSSWILSHPNHMFLRQVDAMRDDKIDEVLRNEAISHLRFLHKSFFKLCDRTFAQAVNLVDRFFIKVKVRPKYGNCVVAGCYLIMAEENKDENTPTCDDVSKISRCGGTSKDLERMVKIIRDKDIDLNAITPQDFLFAMLSDKTTNREQNMESSSCNITAEVTDYLQVVMCFLEYYSFTPACLALAILLHEVTFHSCLPSSNTCGMTLRVEDLQALAHYCGVDWCNVNDCLLFVQNCANQKLYRRGGSSITERGIQRRRAPVSFSAKTLASIIEDDSEPSFNEWSGLDHEDRDADEESLWNVASLFECY